MTWWMKLDQFLNRRRLAYAWIAGGVLWFAWLVSIILGPGNMDMAGQVIGTDYLQFYASGITLRQGQSDQLYDFLFQSQEEQEIAGPGLESFHAFITPPFLAWLFVPLSLLPYLWSFTIWSILGLFFIWLSIHLLSARHQVKRSLWSITWFPVFAAISFGQNSLLSLFLFSLVYWFWRKEHRIMAGLAGSLLLFKPQLVLGFGLLWLLEWRKDWKSLIGLFIGGASLAGACFYFMPEASKAYVDLARNFLPGLIYSEQFPLWHLHSLRGFWTLLFPGSRWLAEGMSLILSLVGVIAFIYIWRINRKEPTLLYTAAIILTIWITPHAMIYDWSILLIPAILLWDNYPAMQGLWKPLYALIWIATFISGPLTYGQLKILPIAFQVSLPVFLLVLIITFKSLLSKSNIEIPA